MASLWEIDERLMNYQMEFDPDTGEWVNEDEWEAIQMDKTEKIKNTIKVIENKIALKAAIKAKIKGLTDRFKTLDKEIDYLKARVGASLGYEKFETDEVKVTFRKSESVVIPDESKVPAEFMEYKSTASPRKDDIKKYLKSIEGSDEKCDWASIETKQNLQLK